MVWHAVTQSLPLTLSPPIPLRLYSLTYWSNPPFLIFDIRAPECQKLKMVHGLDQYGAEPFEQQQFGIAAVEGVKLHQFLANHYSFT